MILKANSFSNSNNWSFYWSKSWPGHLFRPLSWSRSGTKSFSRSLSYSWRIKSDNWSTNI